MRLLNDEKILGFISPINDKGQLAICSECTQIAFRIIRVKSSDGKREISLCGAHYSAACLLFPELSGRRAD
jgi:hypothetical protein